MNTDTVDINEIYKMLNWENSADVRSEGIRLAKELKDLSLLIQPPAPPSVWECCAQILCQKSDSDLEPYLSGLLDWLHDLNWPGAADILNRLMIFSGKMLKESFIASCDSAIGLGDEGIMWLCNLAELLNNKQLKSELPHEIIKKLIDVNRWVSES